MENPKYVSFTRLSVKNDQELFLAPKALALIP
jgi:hypothetical protein